MQKDEVEMMCTAITFSSKDHYFGRTLDYEKSFGESVVITPRNYKFPFHTHFAMIGMAHVAKNYPLYYDAVNEAGLGMAGLNFPGNAYYNNVQMGMQNVASYEMIPFILGQCCDVEEARRLLEHINITAKSFAEHLPPSSLHWMVADKEQALVVEQTEEGLHIYENPIGVLTNNPPFESQMHHLCQYMNLTAKPAENRFAKGIQLDAYSRGMGAVGLPGDVSSCSRFVRAAFTKLNSVCGETEEASVSQFFHILGAVEQVRGCVELEKGIYEITIYTSCCNMDRGIYYYTTYENRDIQCVKLHSVDLNGASLTCENVVF